MDESTKATIAAIILVVVGFMLANLPTWIG